MAGGIRDETRALARLPGLDIAVVHRGGGPGSGEELLVAFRAAPSSGWLGRPIDAADPLLFWTRLSQATWTFWLGCLAAATALPWTSEGE
jgi:hypothetical protein